MGGEGEIDGGNRDDEQMHYNPMVDSFDHTAPTIWDHHPTNSQNLGAFCDMNMQNIATTSSSSLGFYKGNLFAPTRNLDTCWGPTDSTVKRGGMFFPPGGSEVLTHGLSQFPTDSGFIERAARLSSFSGGSFENVINPFGNVHESGLNRYRNRPQAHPQEGFVGNGFKSPSGDGSKETRLPVDCLTDDGRQAKKGGSSFSGNTMAGEAEFSGGGDENSNEGLGSKKRRSDQDTEYNQVKRSPQTPSEVTKNNNECQPKGENTPSSVANKSSGKHGKQVSPSSDAQKEEYIHVRARRGQATNSHSLAERVRREKISERMKFLQDLVPGCSKVTGKAVMLDEIINYVQSLQRQVEFLSMKLATVNPRMDFNLEGLMAKDSMESRLGPSGSLGTDMAMPYALNQSQMAIMQGGISGVGRSSDAGRRTVNSHLMSINGGFKDPASQVPSTWDDELHNIVQMGLHPSTPISSQNLGSTPPGHLKAEP